MAVYTALDEDALAAWLDGHAVGTLVAWRGIESGIENTNYFVTTRDDDVERHFVLTLFERLGVDQLPYYLTLMEHLSRHGIPCPAPMPDRGGALFAMLAGKPAALVTRLAGRSILAPETAHCAALGTLLARMHVAGASFAVRQTNPRGIDWWIATAAGVRAFLDDAQCALLDEEVALQAAGWTTSTDGLPAGPIHADLFRDNALFVDEGTPALRGVIDFYFAGHDVWLLDIAICLNDWCVALDTGVFDAPRRAAFMAAYEDERRLTAAERAALPSVLRAAALRFWLSRLDDFHRPRPAQMLVAHDPTHFERLLRQRRQDALGTTAPGH